MPRADLKFRNAKPKQKPYKLADDGGLFLLVTPNGGKYWRWKYRFASREKLLALGVYPQVSLADARSARDRARGSLKKNGADPMTIRREEKLAQRLRADNTLEAIAREWWDHWRESRTPRHAADVMARLQANIFPTLGNRPIAEITAPQVLAVAREIERRGALEIAHRSVQCVGQVFRYAVRTGRAHHNPAADLRGALRARKKTNYARVDAKELPELLRKIRGYGGSPYTRLALRLMALTFVRTSELIGARWSEFDFDAAQWRIPAERMKAKTLHIVPLSRQAIELLHELQAFSGGRELLFPNERDHAKAMSNNAILYALYRLGYHSRMTGHGFRGVASTLLHEMGFRHDHIELQLAHQERNSTSAAYNHAQYLAERAAMMQHWGDYLDSVEAGAKVIPGKFSRAAA
jgi:integrase